MRLIYYIVLILTISIHSNIYAQLRLFTPNTNENFIFNQPNQIKISTGLMSAFYSSKYISVGLNPFKNVEIIGNYTFNKKVKSMGGQIGLFKFKHLSTSYTRDSAKIENRYGINLVFSYSSTSHKPPNTVFLSNQFAIHGGLHWQENGLIFSGIGKLNIGNVRKITVLDHFYYSNLISEILEKDPYLFPELMTRIEVNRRIFSGYVQCGLIVGKKYFAIDQRIAIRIGVNINATELFQNHKI